MTYANSPFRCASSDIPSTAACRSGNAGISVNASLPRLSRLRPEWLALNPSCERTRAAKRRRWCGWVMSGRAQHSAWVFEFCSGLVDLVVCVGRHGGGGHRLTLAGERFIGLVAEDITQVGDRG